MAAEADSRGRAPALRTARLLPSSLLAPPQQP